MTLINSPTKSPKAELIGQPRTMGVMHQWLAQVATWPWLHIAVGLAMLTALLIPMNLLTSQRFHHDEALYASWALEIASGKNPWLERIPIDKPPLFLYTVAGFMWLLGTTETVARIPSLLATALSIGLIFWLGRKLYDDETGLLAAWLAALSPFTILFAPTVFTDPMLVALVLASCLAAIHGRAGWVGIWLGLAIATKQQGIFFIPLAVGLLLFSKGQVSYVMNHESHTISPAWWTRVLRHLAIGIARYASSLLLGIVIILIPVLSWDFSRDQSAGFWQQSLVNYGGLGSEVANFGERWNGFVELLQYGTASPTLNTILVLGIPVLVIYGFFRISRQHRPDADQIKWQLITDIILLVFSLGFLIGQVLFSFQVWDRYLLGLIPFLMLLLARILLVPWSILKLYCFDRRSALQPVLGMITILTLSALLLLTMGQPIQDTANGRYALGSNSNALRGIEQIVAYLQGQVGANTTLYHHWLGAHWRFYLWDYPYDLQYWSSPSALIVKAQPGHLIAFPTWHSETETRLALAEAGLDLHELIRAYSPTGYPSVILYRIVAK
jgi:4-amino-4-deoxy-L-arabinose transferase-like glycosyltransferase